MAHEERTRGSDSVVSKKLSLIACAQRLTVVLDEDDPVLLAERFDASDIITESQDVGDEHGCKSFHAPLESARAHVECLEFAVDGDWRKAKLHDGHDICRPGHGRNSYSVTTLQSSEIQERLNERHIRCTTVTNERAEAPLMVLRERLLKLQALLSHTQFLRSTDELTQLFLRLIFTEECAAHEGDLHGHRFMVAELMISTYTLGSMRIAYCTNVRLPSERAHGHQIAKVVEALVALGHDVEIFAPYRKNPITQSFESYYGLPSPVKLHHLGDTDGIDAWWAPGVLGLKLTTFLFGRKLKTTLRRRRKDFDLIYTRTPELLPWVLGLEIPVTIELHRIPRIARRRFMKQLTACRLVVALTSHMRQALVDMGAVSVPVIAEGDAVDLHDFEAVPPASETRASLGIGEGIPLIVYAGQLQSMGLSKGIPELLGALRELRKRGLEFFAAIAGGPESARKKFEESLSEDLQKYVRFLGYIPHLKVPTLITAADVLVYPAPKSDHPFYRRDTSPLKLFEYMASGKPIVAADLPPLHDAVDATMVTLTEPGNSEALADGIRILLDDPEGAKKKASLAKAQVTIHTWQKRMERILAAARIGS